MTKSRKPASISRATSKARQASALRTVVESPDPRTPFVRVSKRVNMIPKTLNQEDYISYLTDPEYSVVIATGSAGTGKTLLSVMAAIKALKEGEVKKVVITRPAVGADDEEHGFLPGTLTEKMAPWVIPLMDVFKEYYSPAEVERMLAEEIIDIAPIAFLRGRTFKNAFIIADEIQNAGVDALKLLLTRIGEGSKMVLTGDLKQVDRHFKNDNNGLHDFLDRIEGRDVPGIAVIHFGSQDVQRHPMVKQILGLYGED